MISWKELKSKIEVQAIIEKSQYTPIAIFKHSTHCEISALVKNRLDLQWDIPADTVDVYSVDLHTHAQVSDEIARHFGVCEEPPRLLVIKGGQPIYDASHADVSVENIKRALKTGSNGRTPKPRKPPKARRPQRTRAVDR